VIRNSLGLIVLSGIVDRQRNRVELEKPSAHESEPSNRIITRVLKLLLQSLGSENENEFKRLPAIHIARLDFQ
jgi:hypothetical protein